MHKQLILLLHLLLAALFGNILSAQTWNPVTPAGAGTTGILAYPRHVSFPTSSVGYISGSNSTWSATRFVKTTDGGTSWQDLPALPTIGNIMDIDFITKDEGYALVSEGSPNYLVTLQHTLDGGMTWNDVSPDSMFQSGNEAQVDFIDTSTGYVANGRFYWKTTDGANTWTSDSLGPNYISALDIQFADANHGTIACWDGTFFYQHLIFTTTDGGGSWKMDSIGRNGSWTNNLAQPTATDIYYFCGRNNWSAQGGQVLYKSTNSGQTWDTLAPSIITDSLYKISSTWFTSADTGYVVIEGGGGNLLKTVNGGQDWSLELDDSVDFTLVTFSQGVGYVTGQQGRTFRNGMLNSISPHREPGFRFWPNPGKGIGTLELPTDHGIERIRVINMQGREVWNDQPLPSSSSMSINLKKWPSGLYFMHLEGENQQVIKILRE